MGISILICEPNLTLAEELSASLERENYKCVIALNGRDCQLKGYRDTFSFLIFGFSIFVETGLHRANLRASPAERFALDFQTVIKRS